MRCCGGYLITREFCRLGTLPCRLLPDLKWLRMPEPWREWETGTRFSLVEVETAMLHDNSRAFSKVLGDTPYRILYSGASLKGHSLERTPLYKGHKFLAASTMNVHVYNAPSHQRTPIYYTYYLAEGTSLVERDHCTCYSREMET